MSARMLSPTTNPTPVERPTRVYARDQERLFRNPTCGTPSRRRPRTSRTSRRDSVVDSPRPGPGRAPGRGLLDHLVRLEEDRLRNRLIPTGPENTHTTSRRPPNSVLLSRLRLIPLFLPLVDGTKGRALETEFLC